MRRTISRQHPRIDELDHVVAAQLRVLFRQQALKLGREADRAEPGRPQVFCAAREPSGEGPPGLRGLATSDDKISYAEIPDTWPW